MHPATDPLAHWREFYLLLGTAGAALVALLFVAVSLGAASLPTDRGGPTRTYMSPVAFHFGSVLFASAVGLAPSNTGVSLGILVGCNGLAGTIYAGFVMKRLLTDGIADMADRLAYGLMPLVSYLAMLIAAVLFFAGSPRAADCVAAGVVLLLIINIRNAWDLLLAMAHRAHPGA